MSRRLLHCPVCGRRLTPAIKTVDHFIPRSRGGPNHHENKWPMCLGCNNKKGDRFPNRHELEAFKHYHGGQLPFYVQCLIKRFHGVNQTDL